MSTVTAKRPTVHRRWAPLSGSAKYLGVSEKTLRRMIAAGAINGYRVGPRLIRCDLNEIDAAAHPIPTAAPAAHAAKVVAEAPPPIPAQQDKIAVLLRGAP